MRRPPRFVRALGRGLALALAVAAGACGSTSGAHNDAPGFNVIKKGDVHATMWQLLQDVDALDELMRDGSKAGDERNGETVRLLTRISGSVDTLSSDRNRKSHPLLDERIDFFRQSVTEALEGARQTPPNYYFAGAVAGSCVNCHDPRGGLRTNTP